MVLKRILGFYIRSSLHVALSVLCMAYANARLLEITISIWSAVFIFSGTVVAYNVVKYFPSLKKMPVCIILVTVVAFLIALICVWRLRFETQLWALVAGGFYFVYFKPFSILPRPLRYAGAFLKAGVVAVCWAIVTVFLPWSDAKHSLMGAEGYLPFLGTVSLTLALMVPFELRDMHLEASQVQTLPHILGITGAKAFGIAFIIAFLLCAGFQFPNVLIAIMMSVAIGFSSTKQSGYYSSFLVESIPIFWLLFWLL